MRSLFPILLLAVTACGTDPSLVGDAGVDGGRDGGAEVPGDGGVASEIVAAHNAIRARAMPVPVPPLPQMVWSAEAAAHAAAWVERCEFRHNPEAMTAPFGENIFAASGGRFTPTQVVENWAGEEPDYNYERNTCADVCGHYTQIVWRASTSVGCASKVCTSNSPWGAGSWLFWVCDYLPPGNIVGQRPY